MDEHTLIVMMDNVKAALAVFCLIILIVYGGYTTITFSYLNGESLSAPSKKTCIFIIFSWVFFGIIVLSVILTTILLPSSRQAEKIMILNNQEVETTNN